MWLYIHSAYDTLYVVLCISPKCVHACMCVHIFMCRMHGCTSTTFVTTTFLRPNMVANG